MNLTRITEEDLALYPGVRGQETVPKISVEEKQAKFEERVEKIIVPAFNRLCGEVESGMNAETTRAKTAEKTLEDGKLDKTEQAADAAKLGGQLPDHYAAAEALDEEIDRAKAAEQANADALDEEVGRAKEAEQTNAAAAAAAKAAAEAAQSAADTAQAGANAAQTAAAAAQTAANAAQTKANEMEAIYSSDRVITAVASTNRVSVSANAWVTVVDTGFVVDDDGTYNIIANNSLTAASNGICSFRLFVDGSAITSSTIPVTSGLTSFSNQGRNMYLTAGSHAVKIQAYASVGCTSDTSFVYVTKL